MTAQSFRNDRLQFAISCHVHMRGDPGQEPDTV